MPKLRFEVEQLSGTRLDRAVARHARREGWELSNSKAKQLVDQGAVRVDGREAWKASRKVRSGQLVVAEIPDAWIPDEDVVRRDLSDAVIYRDDTVLAVNKPSGMPTHATHDPNEDHVHAAVLRLLGGDDPYVGIHHRLDVDTSGVLLFAIDRCANKGLADAFSEREAEKFYVCIVRVEAEIPDRFEMENQLTFDRRAGRVVALRSGGDDARTTFHTLRTHGSYAVVRAQIHTGRRHQIRAHLSQKGFPIIGDTLYGGAMEIGGETVGRAMLHAERLALAHPVRGERLELVASWPSDFEAWTHRLELAEDSESDE